MTSSQATIEASLLGLVGELTGLLELGEFRPGLLRALRQVIPADWISLNDLAPDPEGTVVLIEPSFPPEAHALYARHAYENPLVARYERTRDGRATDSPMSARRRSCTRPRCTGSSTGRSGWSTRSRSRSHMRRIGCSRSRSRAASTISATTSATSWTARGRF